MRGMPTLAIMEDLEVEGGLKAIQSRMTAGGLAQVATCRTLKTISLEMPGANTDGLLPPHSCLP